jgi:hypothetical protein
MMFDRSTAGQKPGRPTGPVEGVLTMLAGSLLYALDVAALVLEMQNPGVSERRTPNTKGSRQTRNAC